MTMPSTEGVPRRSILRGATHQAENKPALRPISGGRALARVQQRHNSAAPQSNARTIPRSPAARARAPSPRLLQSWKKRLTAPIGFLLAALVTTTGWMYRFESELSAEQGLGYLLGIIAVGCMLLLLIYPVVKRVKLLRIFGPVRNWFRAHMMLGVLGPVAALFHCNFQLGSLNSQIALYSALLVAGSGLVGRFLYTRIHNGLYGRRSDLKRMRDKVRLTPATGGSAVPFLPELIERMRAFDETVLDPAEGAISSIWLLTRLSVDTRLEYRALIRYTKKQLAAEARRSILLADHQRRLFRTTRDFIADHLSQVRRLAKLQVYDRLFALWHVVHLPFFVLLVVSVIIHVLAVHLY